MKVFLRILLWVFLWGLLFFIGLNTYINSFRDKIYTIDIVPEGYDVALVFGAGVWWTHLSHMLEDRAKTATELYKEWIVSTILISADNSHKDYDEVRPTRDFLIKHGVESWAVFLDFAGFDSYNSLYRAREIFGAEKLILISQDFHLPRILFLCEKLWMDCVAVRADRRNYLHIWYNYMREGLANVKAFFSVLLKVNPYFWGEKIPLTEESNAFWYD